MQPVDLIINARWVLPMEPAGLVIRDGGVAIRDGRILEVASQQSLRQRFSAAKQVDRPQHALLPGLVNAHAHAAMALLRGVPLEQSVLAWLRRSIWPIERRWVSAEFVRTGSQLFIAQLLRAGVTCFADMYYFPEEVAPLASLARIRIAVGVPVIDQATAWSAGADDCLDKGAALWDALRGDPWASLYFAPHAPYSVSDQALARLRTIVDQLDAPVAMHLHESATEVQDGLATHGLRPLERLDALGLLRPGFAAVHMVHCSASDIETTARKGVAVVHCPQSNLRLGSGIAPVGEMLDHGITVAIGSDGPASSGAPDLLAETRIAAMLAAGMSGHPRRIAPLDALRMATLDGARALGLGDQIGSLSAGKYADLIAIDLSRCTDLAPADVADSVLQDATRADVSDVWTAGQACVENRELRTLDLPEVRERARYWATRVGAGSAP